MDFSSTTINFIWFQLTDVLNLAHEQQFTII